MPSKTRPQSMRMEREAVALPGSVETERTLIHGILIGEVKVADIREFVAPLDCTLTLHQLVLRAAWELDGKSLVVDLRTVITELHKQQQLQVGDVETLGSLREFWLPPQGAPQWAKEIHEAASLRQAIALADDIGDRALRGERAVALAASAIDRFREIQASANGTQPEAPPPSGPQWPEPLLEAGFQGLAGKIVRAIEPHSESDPISILTQLLVGFGSLIGRGAYFETEGDRHYTNEFLVLVGSTSKARKGTSWGRTRAILGAVDSDWLEDRIIAGLGSGEAMVDAFSGEDHRALIMEAEFARLLAIISREGSTISALLRCAWDDGTLEVRTRQAKLRIQRAHLSVIGHITREELLRRLSQTEMANGLGNRVLWCCARRSKSLPHGGGTLDLGHLIGALKDAVDHARRRGDARYQFDDEARALWERVYPELSEGGHGLLGSMTSRAEAHTVRFALLFALLDCAEEIRLEHLRAGLEVWRYCFESAKYVWGDALGDQTADAILRALKETSDGLTRSNLQTRFSRNLQATEIDRAIGVLTEKGRIRYAKEQTGGRLSTRYWAL